jgi:histidine triad (HIT) family protein
MAFMTLRPFAAGECTVIPCQHIDHFTDVPDDVAQRIMLAAQRIGRRMRAVFSPQRVGMVVHGYGVPHAHLILVPQNGPYDITSARYAHIENGNIEFSMKNIPLVPRRTLDEHARLLSDLDESTA